MKKYLVPIILSTFFIGFVTYATIKTTPTFYNEEGRLSTQEPSLKDELVPPLKEDDILAGNNNTSITSLNNGNNDLNPNIPEQIYTSATEKTQEKTVLYEREDSDNYSNSDDSFHKKSNKYEKDHDEDD